MEVLITEELQEDFCFDLLLNLKVLKGSDHSTQIRHALITG